jgi:signal transduction histidine kinase/ActR/RegA family two-component response regulator
MNKTVTSENLADRALDAAGTMLFCLDAELRIAHVNSVAAQKTRFERERLLGAHLSIFGKRFATEVANAIECLRPGERTRIQSEILRGDGSALSAGVGLGCMGEGGPVRWVLLGTDIAPYLEAQEKLVEAQAMLFEVQKLEALGRLAGGIAHDFNNILAVIIGNMELLEQNAEGEDREELFSDVRSAVGRGAALVRKLLAFSKQQIASPEVQDPAPLVANLASTLQRFLGERVRVVLDLPASTPPILVDATQLEQILLNLAINSGDAMPNGGELRISMRTRSVDSPVRGSRDAVPFGEYVELNVADTGSGISPEIEKHAFEPFLTTKVRVGGSGLGLATVYGIVRQLGGFIALETQVGHGTRFQILFPVDSSAPARSSETGREALIGQGLRLLYVEDDGDLRRLTARRLVELGFDVTVAKSAEQALDLAGNGKFDVLVSDVVLPGANGLTLAKRLAASQEGIRVLFVSGYAEDASVLGEIVAREHHFLSKPFRRESLAKALRALLAETPFEP